MTGKRGNGLNPFNTYDTNFKSLPAKPFETFSASAVSGRHAQEKRQEISNVDPTSVSLPPHLFMPEDSQSLNIQAIQTVAPATTVDVILFRGQAGSIVRFLSYALYTTAANPALNFLNPLVNGVRCFPYHGDPQNEFAIYPSTTSDLSNVNLVSCLLDLQPTDVLRWTFTNNDIVAVDIGVRMVGYVDQSTIRKIGRFGG